MRSWRQESQRTLIQSAYLLARICSPACAFGRKAASRLSAVASPTTATAPTATATHDHTPSPASFLVETRKGSDMTAAPKPCSWKKMNSRGCACAPHFARRAWQRPSSSLPRMRSS